MSFLIIKISIICLSLQTLSQLIGKWTKDRLVLAGLLSTAALLQTHFHLLYSQELLLKPYFFLSYVPLILLFGPLMRAYFKVLSQESYTFSLSEFLHFLLPLLGLFYYLVFGVWNVNDSAAIINQLYDAGAYGSFYYVSILCGGSLLFYALLILREQPRFFSKDAVLNLPLLLGWALINIVFVIAMTISIFSSTFSLAMTHWGNVLVSVIYISVYLINSRHPDLFSKWLFEIRKSQRSRQYLGDRDPDQTLILIRKAMQDDFLYAEPDLSLQTMAETFELTRYQLSELLNDYAGLNFHDFVASYRVEAAKNILKAESWKKVISVGFEVGFNSQATFNKTFKKFCDMTPSAYQARYKDT